MILMVDKNSHCAGIKAYPLGAACLLPLLGSLDRTLKERERAEKGGRARP